MLTSLLSLADLHACSSPLTNALTSRLKNGPFTYTPLGKKWVPCKELVLQWIHKAWQEIPADLVANSFKSFGISNTLDGTEDEAVWEEEGAGADEADDELENEFDTDSEQED